MRRQPRFAPPDPRGVRHAATTAEEAAGSNGVDGGKAQPSIAELPTESSHLYTYLIDAS